MEGLGADKAKEPESLAEVRELIGKHTADSMQEIIKLSNEALASYRSSKAFLQKGVWYPPQLLEACQTMREPKMVSFLQSADRRYVGYAPPKYFSRIEEKTNLFGYRVLHFIAKQDVRASDAIRAAMSGLTLTDCGGTCQIARWSGLHRTLDTPKYDRLFGSEVGKPINIGYLIDDELQPMRLFVDFTPEAKAHIKGEMGSRPVKKGQLIQIWGVPNYPKKYPLGWWQSHSVICVNDTPGEQLFGGLGMDEKGETEHEIHLKLVKQFNNREDRYAGMDGERRRILENVYSRIGLLPIDSSVDLSRADEVVGGYDPGSPQDFKEDLIKDLMEMPLEDVTMEFVANHRSNRSN